MSIGTAMVVIAIGVFFYLKPEIFKKSVKVGAVVLGVALLAAGGYFGYQHWYPEWKRAPIVDTSPSGKIVPASDLPASAVDIGDLPAFSAICKKGGFECDPWEREWGTRKPLVGYGISHNGMYQNKDGSVMTDRQYDEIVAKEMLASGFCKSTGNVFDQFDDHPKYSFKCGDGHSYEITGPKGSTPDQAMVELLRQQPTLADKR